MLVGTLRYFFTYIPLLWPPCVANADIIFLSCFFFLLLFYSQTGFLKYFYAWCGGFSANLKCRSQNVLHAARWKYRTQKMTQKNHHLRTIAQLCSATSSQLRQVSTISKKLLNISISARCFHNTVNFGPLTAEIYWRVSGTRANFNGFGVSASSLQRHRSLQANQTLQDVWPAPRLQFRGAGRPSRWASAHILVLSFFLSSPTLSRRRVDVCHTFTHSVALV